jgi:CPA1 family monovalent cation:H+ antiporter
LLWPCPSLSSPRFISVSLPVLVLRKFREFTPAAVKIITWGGIRGVISVALALSIPAGPERSVILPVTYATVVFSIIVQGLTIAKLVAKTQVPSPQKPDPGES